MIGATAPMLLAALLLDAALGEPDWLWRRLPHPAVLMGRAVGWCDARFNRGPAPRAAGAAVIAGLAALAGGIGWAVASLPLGWPWQIVGAAALLAQKSLVQHVAAVAAGLRGSLSKGRHAVSMIVGRDTDALDEAAVARAAIESGAENLSDGVVAPAFWFLIGGLPAMLIYKMVNTADSMIGHRTERHEAFGWAAARLDDALSWLPARMTAAAIALAHGDPHAWAVARRDGPRHRSVNAGWPEAAMAAVLRLSLSGPRSYAGTMTDDPEMNAGARRSAGPDDIDRSVGALWRVWAGLAGAMLLLTLASAG